MLKLHDILRAGTIKRWHIVNTARQQTNAEHQHNVAVLAQNLCHRLNIPDEITLRLMAAALVHDAGECKTGDIPTPFKKELRASFGAAFEEMLAKYDPVPSLHRLPPEAAAILKCADYLDSLLFLEENKVGRHAEAVFVDIKQCARRYFTGQGDVGAHAVQLYNELANAVYEI